MRVRDHPSLCYRMLIHGELPVRMLRSPVYSSLEVVTVIRTVSSQSSKPVAAALIGLLLVLACQEGRTTRQ